MVPPSRTLALASNRSSRFLSSPFIIRVPFFRIFSLIRKPYTKKGKRVLLSSLVLLTDLITQTLSRSPRIDFEIFDN